MEPDATSTELRRRDRVQKMVVAVVLLAVTAPTWTLGGGFVDDTLAHAGAEYQVQRIADGNVMPALREMFWPEGMVSEGRMVPLLLPYQALRFSVFGDNYLLERILNTLIWLALLLLVYALTRRISSFPAAPLLASLFVLCNPASSTALYRLQTQEQLIAPLLLAYLLMMHSSLRALQSDTPHPWRRAAGYGVGGCVSLLTALGFKETAVSIFPAAGLLFVLHFAHENRRVRIGSVAWLGATACCGLAFVGLYSLIPERPGSYTNAYSLDDVSALLHSALLWRDKLRVAYGGLAYLAVAALAARVFVAMVQRRLSESLKWRLSLLVYAGVTIALLLPWEKDEGRLMLHGLCGFAIVMAIELGEAWRALRRLPVPGRASRAVTIAAAALVMLLAFVWLLPPLVLPLSDRYLHVTIPALIVTVIGGGGFANVTARLFKKGIGLPNWVRWTGRGALAANVGYVFLFALPGMWNANVWDYGAVLENPHNNALCRYLAAVMPYRGRVFVDQSFLEWTGTISWAGTIEHALVEHGRPDILVYPISDVDEATDADAFVSFGRAPVYGANLSAFADTNGRPLRESLCELPVFNIDALQPRNLVVNALGLFWPSATPYTQFTMTDDRSWRVYLPVNAPRQIAGPSTQALDENALGWSPLHEAACRGDHVAVAQRIAEGCDLNAQTLWGDTPLRVAANAAAVEALLNAGADAFVSNQWGDTPLHDAALRRDRQSCELLLDGGADVDARGRYGDTPLHLAAARHAKGIVGLLLAHGASSGVTDERGRSPIHYAAYSLSCRRFGDDDGVLQAFIDAGADVNSVDARGRQPLHEAARASARTASWLVRHGADVSHQDEDGRTPLHAALSDSSGVGKEELVELLLSKGADCNARDITKKTPLQYAASVRPWSLIRTLAEHHADINATDADGNTPLMLAGRYGQLPLVDALLDFRPKLDVVNSAGMNALMVGVNSGHYPTVSALIAAGATADDDAVTTDGMQAIHLAAAMGDPRMVQLLLNHGADPDARAKDGPTPLLTAAEGGRYNAFLQLMEAGATAQGQWTDLLSSATTCVHKAADDDAFNHVSQVQDRAALVRLLLSRPQVDEDMSEAIDASLYAAATSGHPVLLAPILEHVDDVNHPDKEGRLALEYAVQSESVEAVEMLLLRGASVPEHSAGKPVLIAAASAATADELVPLLLRHGARHDSTADDGSGALDAAAAGGHAVACRALLDAGADASRANSKGIVPLHRAARSGTSETLEILLDAGADPNVKDVAEHTPIALALQNRRTDLADTLVRRGAHLDANDPALAVAAIQAARHGALDAIVYLLDHGLNPNLLDPTGQPLLNVAVTGGNPALVDVMIARGVNVAAADRNGITALHWAARDSQVPIVSALLAAGADVNARAGVNSHGKGSYPIHLAVKSPELVRLLARNGARVNVRDSEERTPLLLALIGGHSATAAALLDLGADPNLSSAAGVFPIMAALKVPDAIEPLLFAGADVNVESQQGLTTLVYAIATGDAGIVKRLLDAGADVNVPGVDGATLLEHTIDVPEILRVFLDAGVDPDVRSASGDAALHVAATVGAPEAVNVLLEAGADPDAPGQGGDTPLHRAIGHNHADIAAELLSKGADATMANADGVTCLDLAATADPATQRVLEPYREPMSTP